MTIGHSGHPQPFFSHDSPIKAKEFILHVGILYKMVKYRVKTLLQF